VKAEAERPRGDTFWRTETRIEPGPIPATYWLQGLGWGHQRQWDRGNGPKDGDQVVLRLKIRRQAN